MHYYIALLCIIATAVSAISSTDKSKILNAHNDVRQDTKDGKMKCLNGVNCPGATSMPDLLWDPALAALAQQYADQCKFGHEANSIRKNKFLGSSSSKRIGSLTFPANSWDGIGENLAYRSEEPTTNTAEQAVTNWGPNEAVDYKWGRLDETDYCEDKCGHFTQIVTAQTQYVGCGIANCRSNPAAGAYKSVTVCNYYPPGNYPRRAPYPCTPGDTGCDVDASPTTTKRQSGGSDCVAITNTGKWYVDGTYDKIGEYQGKPSYKGIGDNRYGRGYYLYYTGSRWQVASTTGKSSYYARCDSQSLLGCVWSGFSSSNTRTSSKCASAMGIEETPNERRTNDVMLVVILAILLIVAGNAVFCFYMKRKMLRRKGMEAVLDENEMVDAEDGNVETETALTQN